MADAYDPSTLRIIHYPDPRLRVESRPIDDIDEHLRAVAQRMLQLVEEANGIGLAAAQVGLNIRMFVTKHTPQPEDREVYINPILSEPQGQEIMEEGCLSIPDVRGEIRRAKSITIAYTSLDGQQCFRTSDDLLARVWQHEHDHISGILILDRMGPVDKLKNRRLIKHLENEYRAAARPPVAAH